MNEHEYRSHAGSSGEAPPPDSVPLTADESCSWPPPQSAGIMPFCKAQGPWDDWAVVGTTTRVGGVSRGPWSTLNLGVGTGDDPRAVAENRRRLCRGLALPREPCWLRQVHGTRVVRVTATTRPDREEADGAWTDEPGIVLSVLTADCVPAVLLTRDRLAVAHAGWRGFASGILESALEVLGRTSQVLAWIGPAIDPLTYVVGEDVLDACLRRDPGCGSYFRPARGGRFHCDLPGIVAHHLRALGIRRVYRSWRFTATEPEWFYSYRREGTTGRQATLAWLLPGHGRDGPIVEEH